MSVNCTDTNALNNQITYVLDLYTANKRVLLRNYSSENPAFLLTEINPDQDYVASIYAENSLGSSMKIQVTIPAIRPLASIKGKAEN